MISRLEIMLKRALFDAEGANVRRKVKDYFGVRHKDADPTKVAITEQAEVSLFLSSASEVIRRMIEACQRLDECVVRSGIAIQQRRRFIQSRHTQDLVAPASAVVVPKLQSAGSAERSLRVQHIDHAHAAGLGQMPCTAVDTASANV